MIKELKMDFFSEGTNVSEFVCAEVSTAVACGYFNVDYYYYYLLYSCINANWKRKNETDSDVFRKLGLEFKEITFNDKTELIALIKQCIDNNSPVLLPIKYNQIIFFERYKDESVNGLLYFLINGYNSSNDTIYTRLSPFIFSVADLNNNIGFYPFKLPSEILASIWDNSNEYFISEDLEIYVNKFFSVEQKTHSEILCCYDILLDFISNYDFEKNIFLDNLMKLDYNNETEFFDGLYYIRLENIKHFKTFFLIIEQFLRNSCVDNNLVDEISMFKDEYIRKKNSLTTRYQKHVQKKQKLDMQVIIAETKQIDEKLFDLLREITMELEKEYKLYHQNCTLTSKVYASSIYDVEETDVKNIISDTSFSWRSKNEEGPHWVMFEFPEIIRIKKIVIIHDSNVNKKTKDFSIQGSNDSVNWDELVTINKNIDYITTHEFSSIYYKYIRIYITLPGILDNHARIKQVDIYGG